MPANPKKELANYDSVSFLTKQEVATLFRVTPGTVDNWKKAGLLHPLKMGHFLMFPKPEIEEIINGNIEAPFIYKIVEEADRRALKIAARKQASRP